MKNIHLLPTEKPNFGRYLVFNKENILCIWDTELIGGQKTLTPHHIYITSDEEIKEGDWVLYGFNLETIYEGGKDWKFTESDIIKCISLSDKGVLLHKKGSTDKELCKKIILTTDPDLIKDGVQAIDDEFLEWFVKNPSCEFVEWSSEKIEGSFDGENWKYKYGTVIPQEEPKHISAKPFLDNADEVIVIHRPKQETIEETAKRLYPDTSTPGYIDQYSEIARKYFIEGAKWQAERMYSEEDLKSAFFNGGGMKDIEEFNYWFEQFKKK